MHRSRRWCRFPVCFVVLACALIALWSGCRNAPVTGRKQLLLVPESREIALGEEAYREVVASEPASSNGRFIELVNRVGQRIAAVAGRSDYQWEFRVLASDEQNAFALPGGKVAVYEGILPVCQNEAGLAVVMSHEVAHALARHGGERMSQAGAVNAIGQAISVVSQNESDQERKLLLGVYGAASKYGFILPYSREHESEADRIGLQLMARAGYDPREAPEFWRRFAAAGGSKPPEFLSTHPSDEHRAEELNNLLPQALQLYEQAPQKYGRGETIVPAGR